VRLAENAPNLRPNGVGEIYRDNVILAWGHALAGGGTTSRFNVLSVSQTSTGAYRVVLETPATSVNTMAITVTPRVTYAVPGTFVAANARNVVIDKIDAATFDVYIGTIATTSAAINTEFTFIVTGR
jgi:hypothetical protein